MVCRDKISNDSDSNSDSDINGLRAHHFDQRRTKATKQQQQQEQQTQHRKRRRQSNHQTAAISSKYNNSSTANPSILLRTIIMVTTMLYHSVRNSQAGRIAPNMILVANAWTATTSSSRSARGGDPRFRRRIPSSSSCSSSSSSSSGHCQNSRRFFETTGCALPASSQTVLRTVTSTTRMFSTSESSLSATTTLSESKSPSASSSASLTTAASVLTPSSTHHNDENENAATAATTEDWKESPLVNPTITFETLLVPNSQLTKWITHPGLQHKLAKPDNWEFLKHVHPRIKLVQDYVEVEESIDVDIDNNPAATTNKHKNKNTRYKQLLLLPSSLVHATANHTATGMGMGMGIDIDMLSSDGSSEDETTETESDAHAWLSELLAAQEEEEEDVIEPETEPPTPSIRRGPPKRMSFSPKQLSFQFLLKTLLPESAHPPPASYEQIGHVAHFNLKEKHLAYKSLIGSALLESTSGDSIQTVVNKVGQVDGKYRTYECEILANVFDGSVSGTGTGTGNDTVSSLETTVVEDGISIELNVAECYWCTRLSGERRELIRDILKGRKVGKQQKQKQSKGGKRKEQPQQQQQPSEIAAATAALPISSPPPLVVADIFCGAGAVCMLLAKKIKDQDKLWKPEQLQLQQQQQQLSNNNEPPSLTILANDWNPRAIEYMKRSIATNGMDKENDESLYHKFELSCKDSYDFLSALGEEQQTTTFGANPYIKSKLLRKKKKKSQSKTNAKTNETANESANATSEQQEQQPPPLMPDHVLMNFPLEAPQFLGALRWWSWKRLRDEGIRRAEPSDKSKSGPSESEWSPRFHVYTFARSSSPRANDEDEMAVNLVANELLPEPHVDDDDETEHEAANANANANANAKAPNDESENATTITATATAYRRNELNDEFGTNFSTRVVRDVAPGKVVVCVSFSVTPKLIRYMQGDFS